MIAVSDNLGPKMHRIVSVMSHSILVFYITDQYLFQRCILADKAYDGFLVNFTSVVL